MQVILEEAIVNVRVELEARQRVKFAAECDLNWQSINGEFGQCVELMKKAIICRNVEADTSGDCQVDLEIECWAPVTGLADVHVKLENVILLSPSTLIGFNLDQGAAALRTTFAEAMTQLGVVLPDAA